VSLLHDFARRAAADPRAALPLSLWSGLGLIDLIVWSRWLSGAMTVPLPAFLAIGSSLFIAAVAVAALIVWRQTERNWTPRISWWPELLALTLGLLWGLAVGWGTSPFSLGGLTALWGMQLVAVGFVAAWFPESGTVSSEREPASGAAGSAEVRSVGDSRPATHSQRRLVIDGGEIIEGEAQVVFHPGQKEAVVHLSFCPPLAVVPEVHGEDALSGELEVKAQAVQTFGARLSVRRTERLDRSETGQISYVAFPPGSDAA
jgi:hypothetical protein